MPYLSCPRPRLDLYSATTISAAQSCPACGTELIVCEAGRPEPARSLFLERRLPRARASVTKLVELERRVAARRQLGRPRATAERQLRAPATLAEAQRSLVRFYASRPAAGGSHRSPRPSPSGGVR